MDITPLNVLFAASEVSPLAKTGGLADVSGSLPVQFFQNGIAVAVIMPRYQQVPIEAQKACSLSLPIGDQTVTGSIEKTTLPGTDVPLYLVVQDDYFNRPSLYTEGGHDFPDNLERFTFFSRAVLELVRLGHVTPDIIHSNDWQSALIPVYLKTLFANDPKLSKVRSLYTIHNLAYQGVFPKEKYVVTGLPTQYFSAEGLEFWDHLNLMKGGIVFSDLISTVSRRYAEEIQTTEFGCGLEGVLQQRNHKLVGVLNGVDYSDWSPENDAFIPYPYSIDNAEEGKLRNKVSLLEAFRLPIDNLEAPVLGVVSRLVSQKGLDLFSEIIPHLIRYDARICVLGTGDPFLEDLFESLHRRFPRQCGVRILYDNHLAHLVEAGSDLFIMPSRYEPCGLNQMYSLRYGTIPMVRDTGGLSDTIKDYTRHRDGYGFMFHDQSPEALMEACMRAMTLYQNRHVWSGLVRRAMLLDFSWDRSAQQYVQVYKRILQQTTA